MSAKTFYERYWKGEHIKSAPFTSHPYWTFENYRWHVDFFKPFGRVLDFGCGAGELTRWLAYYNQVDGVDISPTAIEEAKKTGCRANFQVLKDKIPCKERTYDCVFAIDVLEHLIDLEGTLAEFHRVLKPAGRVFIATTELTKLKLLAIMLKGMDNYFHPASPHIRYFTKKSLADLLEHKGFKVTGYRWNRSYLGLIPKGQMVIAEKR